MKYQGVPIHEITIYKHPLLYLQLCIYLLGDLVTWLKNFFIRRCLYIVGAALVWGLVTHVSFLHVFLGFIGDSRLNSLLSLRSIG